ncbi:MAG: helix-turn-helix transcriptional regulator [Phenylobacterium sp.]|uniref:helix-turn-helix domain-containing protein n=1 Tax=Phenylobacterium sp. TaxID=1871053 RepID=UPI0027271F18|nr:helix-turn-helix transcriptional regulator [Phenylobacterium sp.]MDO9430569.1 helix-turn-helix transcriptional regulator [Phenylobacterium sp.]
MIISLPPVNADLEVLGRRLRAIREARGLGLERLADEVQLSHAELSMAEHGRLRLGSAQLHALTAALHVSPRILFEPAIDVSKIRPF